MIFFKKKKPTDCAEPSLHKKEDKAQNFAQAIFNHDRILTAEGWRRLAEKRASKKTKQESIG